MYIAIYIANRLFMLCFGKVKIIYQFLTVYEISTPNPC